MHSHTRAGPLSRLSKFSDPTEESTQDTGTPTDMGGTETGGEATSTG